MDKILNIYQTLQLAGFALALACIFLIVTWRVRAKRLDWIPGPRGYPLIGLGYKLPPKAPALFRKWALEYGDIFKVRVGWYDWVVVNTPEAVREILEKQANVSSSKIPAAMSHDTVTRGNRMPSMPYGRRWRSLRTIIRRVTTVPMTATYIPSQEFEAKQLLFDLATENGNQRNFFQHMRRYSFSIIMTNTFGRRVRTVEDPDVQNAVLSQAILRESSKPGAFIVDMLPPLAILPKWMRPGQKRAEKAANQLSKLRLGVWRRFEETVLSGKAPPCFAREIYNDKDSWYDQGLTEELLAWVSTGIVEAGFETTAATLNTLVLYLANNIRCQDEAAKELMQVVGQDRLPNHGDMRDLPYIRACIKETLRLNPILAPGIRHFTDQDITYKGNVIPKGTVLIANTAFLHYDPRRFKDPFEFMPERYLEHNLYSADYAAMSDPGKRDHFTFSTGRRVCPGARLAENSLNIALAGILWAFEIRPPLLNGVEVKMNMGEDAYLDAGFTMPKPFAARFVPRTEQRLQLVKEEWQRAIAEGYELRGVSVDLNGMME